MMRFHFGVIVLWMAACAFADDAGLSELERQFDTRVRPLIATHCLSCHDTETQEAKLDLTMFHQLQDVTRGHLVWETILERLSAGEMPPDDATPRLTKKERGDVVHWIREVRQFEATRNAGDPGTVLARRLSNAEFDYSVRDLTGVDIRPTKTFPVDPANEAGFDNSGESLTMSPALMKKYVEAARAVVDHLVLTPHDIRFAPHPVVTDTDRDKYCVKRIVEYYQRQPTDYAHYFYAAWSYLHRDALGKPAATLDTIAAEHSVSAKYLATIWRTLTEEPVEYGPLAKLQRMWGDLPNSTQADNARVRCQRMQDYLKKKRKEFEPTFDNLVTRGVHNGSQTFVLWKNKQYATHRRSASFIPLDKDNVPTDESIGGYVARIQNTASLLSAADQDEFKAACEKFCSVFPDAFYVSERGRDYLGKPRDEQEKGRLLSAGFHSMMGYFRDDQPLYELILDKPGQQELDALWQELDFITAAPMRQYQGFLWFERTDSGFLRDPEFDFARPEDKTSLSEPMIDQLADLYLAKATRNGGGDVPLRAILDYFQEINQQIRWVEQTRLTAEPRHVDAVVALAAQAYRRPLSSDDEEELREFYQSLRANDQLSHEEAIQDTIVAILMSPRFCYRLDLLSDTEDARALNGFELASRLSYFLWSSSPDAELRAHARTGDLLTPKVLLQQARRMLRDERVRGLATEFGGNWLDVRRFEEHNSVDRERFPEFNDGLRSAMFEEPMRFFTDIVQHDRSILDFLYSDRTFVNDALAKHYAIGDLSLAEEEWREISDANRFDRGGLLPMAVFLTKNAPGLRTSPVKRGYWVVRRLLGERIPPPPPNVPELPDDESQLGDLTLRETLAKHRDHQSCAGCHDRFDSIGLAFEGFGPIGERRNLDLGGKPVDTRAIFPDGSERDGVADLRQYLREEREAEFVDNLCRKLLCYALSRTLLLSDDSLLQKMREDSVAEGYRFSKLVEAIVTSPQFLNKRGRGVMDLNVDAGDSHE